MDWGPISLSSMCTALNSTFSMKKGKRVRKKRAGKEGERRNGREGRRDGERGKERRGE